MSVRSLSAAMLGMLWLLGAVLPARADEGPFKTNPGEIAPELRVPPYLPAPPPLARPARPQIVTPAPSPPQFIQPVNPGPVTNYGTGGMQQMPGAPPNPPYSGR